MRGADLFLDGIPGTEEYEIEEEIGHGTFSEVRYTVAEGAHHHPQRLQSRRS